MSTSDATIGINTLERHLRQVGSLDDLLISEVEPAVAYLLKLVPQSDKATLADYVIAMWETIRSQRLRPPLRTLLIALRAVLCELETNPAISSVLGQYRMNLRRTEVEVRLQLGFTLFKVARQSLGNLGNTPVFRSSMEEAIAHLEYVSLNEQVFSPTGFHDAQRKSVFGSLGVANLFLARGEQGEKEYPERIKAACRYLRESACYGNDGPERYEYEIDALTRYYYYCLPSNDTELADTLSSLKNICNEAGSLIGEGGATAKRGLRYSLGQALRALAASARTNGDAIEAKHFSQQAYEQFSRLVDKTGPSLSNERIIPQGSVFGLRVQAALELLRARVRLGELATNDDVISAATAVIDEFTQGELPDLLTVSTGVPDVLVWRGQAFLHTGRIEEAYDDLTRAHTYVSRAANIPEKQARRLVGRLRELDAGIALLLLECSIWRAMREQDTTEVFCFTAKLAESLENRNCNIPAATLAEAGEYLLTHVTYAEASPLITRIEGLLRLASERSSSDSSAKFFSLSHLGNILRIAGEKALAIEARADARAWLQRACDAFTEASAYSESAVAEFYGYAANSFLALAKLLIREGDPRQGEGMLRECVALFETALASQPAKVADFHKRVAYSKLGEAHIRLAGITASREHAVQAIKWLTRSREEGNQEPELLGLLADAYLRKGLTDRNAAELREVVTLKELAYASDAKNLSWKENRSVTSAVFGKLWEIEGNIVDLQRSILTASAAINQDVMWAWPYFQLAEALMLAQDCGVELPELAVVASELSAVPLDAQAAFRRGFELGSAERIRDLHGSSFVHTIEDDYGLLNHRYVFKHTGREAAAKETAACREFSDFLRKASAPRYLSLPDPIGVLESSNSEKLVCAQRFAQGQELSSILVDGRADASLPLLLERCLEFLACYHAWRKIEPLNSRRRQCLLRRSKETARDLGLDGALRMLLRENSFGVAFKDSHTRNWLVGRRNEIIMIDLERIPLRLPLLWELALLIEDFPVFAPDSVGWESRLDLCRKYMGTLERLVETPLSVPDSSYGSMYEGGVIFHSLWVAGRFSNGIRACTGLCSKTSTDLWEDRIRHLARLLLYIASCTLDCNRREMAQVLSARLEKIACGEDVAPQAKGLTMKDWPFPLWSDSPEIVELGLESEV